jgi:hypothetical protein
MVKFSQIKFSNSFATLQNLEDDGDINRAWETVRENVKIFIRRELTFL